MILVNTWKTVVLERFAKFDGRAGRAEYWWFVLANLIAYVVLAILMQIATIFVILLIGFWLAIIVPSIAVAVRRLHDTNKSGWFLLISLIPFVGGIILLVFLATAGDPGPNNYGAPDPGIPAA
jgi:uncharacterized membrane protein YhaH (DUF805 family)